MSQEEKMSRRPFTALRIASHVLVFLLAVVVFYLGLGVGLSQNPLWGTLLWLAAVAIGVLNVKWMRRARRSRP